MMKWKTFFILLMLISGTVLLSCRTRMTPAQKRAYKMEKKMKKENEKMVKEFYEHHYKIQPAQSQKMMKKSRKRAKNINKKRRESWFKRTFSRKKSKSCDGN